MPHIIVEHSQPPPMDMSELVKALHDAAADIDGLPLGGLRTRVLPAGHARVADAGEDNAFVYVTVRIGAGRDDAKKREIGDKLFAQLRYHARDRFEAGRPTSLGLEVQEIAPGTTWKHNNIHDILKARA